LTDLGGKTCIFSHPVYLFLREFSLQDSRGGSVSGKIASQPIACLDSPSANNVCGHKILAGSERRASEQRGHQSGMNIWQKISPESTTAVHICSNQHQS
ncbi:hypothetical protein ACS1UG_004102, partial [Escherichia coli]